MAAVVADWSGLLMVLTPQNERFVLHFGEMGSRWGVNRTVCLLYTSDAADE